MSAAQGAAAATGQDAVAGLERQPSVTRRGGRALTLTASGALLRALETELLTSAPHSTCSDARWPRAPSTDGKSSEMRPTGTSGAPHHGFRPNVRCSECRAGRGGFFETGSGLVTQTDLGMFDQSPTSIELRSHHILNAFFSTFASKSYQ